MPELVATTPFGEGFINGLRPPPSLTVSEWADRYRVLSQRSSAEPGRYRTDRTPYLREIADHLSPQSDAEIVVLMKGAQVGATEIGNNWIGYIIHHASAPTLMVMPTVETAKRNSKMRIAPMIEECSELRDRVKDPRSRDSGNTLFQKDFPGGTLLMTGANSAVGLRSVPVRNLFLDEVDGYPTDVDGEGDPVELALKRTATFGHRRKVFIPSTPTWEATSRVKRAYLQGDQRRYHVPCPECGHKQEITWAHIDWPKGKPREAAMKCEACEERIPESQKTWMLENGEWVATAESDGRIVSYHLSALYSPLGWYSWGDAAADFLKARDEGRESMRTWSNLCLGETFDDDTTSVGYKLIYDRRESWGEKLPEPVLLLTAGADVQHDRIEMEVVAWGRGQESWSVDYRIFRGDTQQAAVWRALDDALQRAYAHARGVKLRIAATCIDAGFATGKVAAFVAPRRARRVFAVIGRAGDGRPIISDARVGRRKKRGREDFVVGVDNLKRELYSRLLLEEAGPGYCHFPFNEETHPEEYFKQLCGEKLQTTKQRGQTVHVWVKDHTRVEGLDCRIYATAALHVFNPTWEALEAQIRGAAEKKSDRAPSSISPSDMKRLRAQARRQRD